MQYTFKPRAFKQLEKLPRNIQKRIIKKLDFYSLKENPIIYADSLTDRSMGSYRFRIGDYRVVFDVEGNGIVILLIRHRKDIYR